MLGIIAAVQDEISPVIERMQVMDVQKAARLDIYTGKYGKTDVAAVFSGVCKVNAALAAQLLIDKMGVERMIMIGAAGAIDPQLRIGDTVVATDVAHHDVAGGILTNYHPWMPTEYFATDRLMSREILAAADNCPTGGRVLPGRMVSGEAFIEQEGREQIIQNHNPLCVDMETAAVAQVCYANDIPFAAIRCISDTPHDAGEAAYEQNATAASQRAAQVLGMYLDGQAG